MLAAVLTVCCWSFSAVYGSKAARLMGSMSTSFWRLLAACVLLGLYAHLFSIGMSGPALGWFLASGAIGFGLGDTALYFAFPRIGSRLAMIFIHCLAAPIAAAIEYFWMDVTLTPMQLLSGATVLLGVGVALSPQRGAEPHPHLLTGAIFGIIAAFGQGAGAVLTRRGYALTDAAGVPVDGLTSAYQRLLGGMVIATIGYLVFRWVSKPRPPLSPEDRSIARKWVLLNALLGPAIGASFYQWALATTPAGIVLPIISLTPLIMIPISKRLEGGEITSRSIIGGAIAVLGVILLHIAR